MRSLAALIVFYKGNWRGETITLNDNTEIISFFEYNWKDPSTVAYDILSNTELWGQHLTLVEGLEKTTNAFIEELLEFEKTTVSS